MLSIIIFLITIIIIILIFSTIESFTSPKKIGVIIIATNAYFLLGLRFLKQWLYYCDHRTDYVFYFFSDKNVKQFLPSYITNVCYIPTKHDSWVAATNSKFSNILAIKDSLVTECDSVYYFDADTSIHKKFTKHWFHKGTLIGGEHFNNRTQKPKPYDRNPKSTAYIPHNTPFPQMYYYGAFFGGSIPQMITLCNTIISNQRQDRLINYEPIWNDESYLNHYFHYHVPTVVYQEQFEFRVSDKGGLVGDSRRLDNDWQNQYLQYLTFHLSEVFDFAGGKLVVVGGL